MHDVLMDVEFGLQDVIPRCTYGFWIAKIESVDLLWDTPGEALGLMNKYRSPLLRGPYEAWVFKGCP